MSEEDELIYDFILQCDDGGCYEYNYKQIESELIFDFVVDEKEDDS